MGIDIGAQEVVKGIMRKDADKAEVSNWLNEVLKSEKKGVRRAAEDIRELITPN